MIVHAAGTLDAPRRDDGETVRTRTFQCTASVTTNP